jgi:antitoxin (DNA-binding transcriptional repressor) of toxin-antitoxin stability system
MAILVNSGSMIDSVMPGSIDSGSNLMIRLNIHEAKTHLSKYLDRLAEGETIILCKRNIPIAEIRPIPFSDKTPRPIGLAKGQFQVPPEFHEPLPAEILAAFEGEAG